MKRQKFPTIGSEHFAAVDWGSLPDDNDIIDELELVSFTATPQTARPFESASLSWEITGPTNKVKLAIFGPAIWTESEFLTLNQIEAIGTQTVSPLTTTNYYLKARRGAAVKIIGVVSLEVDLGELEILTMPGRLIEEGVKSYVDWSFTRNTSVTLRGENGSTVMMEDDGLSASIPLKIHVPNWFNADMDIDLDFSIFTRRSGLYTNRLVTELETVDVDVSWHWLEHLLSLGSTIFTQAALDAALKALIMGLMGELLADNLSNSLNSFPFFGVEDILRSMGGQGRPFLLHSINVLIHGIDIMGCPDPRS